MGRGNGIVMEKAKENGKKDGGNEFKWFMTKRVLIGVAIVAALLWVGGSLFELFEESAGELARTGAEPAPALDASDAGHETVASHEAPAADDRATGRDEHATADDHEAAPAGERDDAHDPGETAPKAPAGSMKAFLEDLDPDHEPAEPPAGKLLADAKKEAEPTDHREEPVADHVEAAVEETHGDVAPGHKAEEAPTADHAEEAASDHAEKAVADHAEEATPDHGEEAVADHAEDAVADHAEKAAPDHAEKAVPEKKEEAHAAEAPHAPRAKGVAFVEAAIKPLDYELNERFWGWRTNDIIRLTDNVNSYQMGVLEVTRRTAVILTERLSRIGSSAAYDEDLEQSMNWLMIKPENYWFPRPESKYQDALDNMRLYMEKLEKGEASFYTRADNLIPLLTAYKDLLGSCDENLVKATEKSGIEVSFFKADNYFYYAQGTAGALGSILEAVHHDFEEVLKSRDGAEALHHAIESCHRATGMDPWIILDSSLSSVFANHRANMAAAISHAKFYLEVMIKVLST